MQGEKPDVILIAYYFPPDSAIGAARPYRFYKYLKRAGYRCHVITASRQTDEALPDVHFVPDETAALWQSPRRTPMPAKAHVERVIRKWAIPGGLGISWSVSAARRCRALLRNGGRASVLFSSFPPVGALFAGVLAARREGIPWIADFRDPLVNPCPGRLDLGGPTCAALHAAAFRTASALIANTEHMAAEWSARLPRLQSKIHVIWNGFDPEDEIAAREIPQRPYRLLAHAGALYAGRNPNLLLQSLARLRAAGPEARALRILLVGSVGAEAGIDNALCERAVREGWLDLRTDPVPAAEARRLTAEADFLLLLQPQSKVQVPGKLFEYLRIGRPVLAIAPENSASEFILKNSGVPHVCIYPDDPPAVCDRKLLEAMRLPSTPVRFNAWFEERFHAQRQAAQLAFLIEGAVPPARRRTH